MLRVPVVSARSATPLEGERTGRTDVCRACSEEAVGLCLGRVLDGRCGRWPGCDGRQRRRHRQRNGSEADRNWLAAGRSLALRTGNPKNYQSGNTRFLRVSGLTARLEWAPPASSLSFSPLLPSSPSLHPTLPLSLLFYYSKWPTHPMEESSRYVPPFLGCTGHSHCRRTRPSRRADDRKSPCLPWP